jgi:hypothetical protein
MQLLLFPRQGLMQRKPIPAKNSSNFLVLFSPRSAKAVTGFLFLAFKAKKKEYFCCCNNPKLA